jgi:hypothetical protein
MKNENGAPLNPIIHAIPEGQEVTVITAHGGRYTGTDDTSGEDAEKGIFVLYSYNQARGHSGLANANKKTYLRAVDIVGFEIEYNA